MNREANWNTASFLYLGISRLELIREKLDIVMQCSSFKTLHHTSYGSVGSSKIYACDRYLLQQGYSHFMFLGPHYKISRDFRGPRTRLFRFVGVSWGSSAVHWESFGGPDSGPRSALQVIPLYYNYSVWPWISDNPTDDYMACTEVMNEHFDIYPKKINIPAALLA